MTRVETTSFPAEGLWRWAPAALILLVPLSGAPGLAAAGWSWLPRAVAVLGAGVWCLSAAARGTITRWSLAAAAWGAWIVAGLAGLPLVTDTDAALDALSWDVLVLAILLAGPAWFREGGSAARFPLAVQAAGIATLIVAGGQLAGYLPCATIAPDGGLGNPNFLGEFLMLAWAVTLPMILEAGRPPVQRAGSGLLLTLFACGIWESQCQGAWLGALVALAATGFGSWRRGWILVLVAVPLSGWLAWSKLPLNEPFERRPATTRFRQLVWQQAFGIAGARPWRGAGPGQFPVVYAGDRPIQEAKLHDAGVYVNHPHSEPLNAAAERGLPGLLFWLLAPLGALAAALRSPHACRLLPAIFGMAAAALVGLPLSQPATGLIWAFLLAGVLEDGRMVGYRARSSLPAALFLGVSLLGAGILWVPRGTAERLTLQAERLAEAGDCNLALTTSRRALERWRQSWHLTQRIAMLRQDCGQARQSLDAVRLSLTRHPNRPETWLMAARDQAALGDINGVLLALGHTLALAPAWTEAATFGIRTMLLRQRPEEAYGILDRFRRNGGLADGPLAFQASVLALWTGDVNGALEWTARAEVLIPSVWLPPSEIAPCVEAGPIPFRVRFLGTEEWSPWTPVHFTSPTTASISRLEGWWRLMPARDGWWLLHFPDAPLECGGAELEYRFWARTERFTIEWNAENRRSLARQRRLLRAPWSDE